MLPLIINFFGGPCTAKTSMAASLFSELKWLGSKTEYVTEYAKDKVWEESFNVLSNQIYVFGKQQHKIFRLGTKVDIIVVDSPLLLSLIYDKNKTKYLKQLVLYEFNKRTNLNFLMKRSIEHPYEQSGRYQNEEDAKKIDLEVEDMLFDNNIEYECCLAEKRIVPFVVDQTLLKLEEIKNATTKIN